MKEVIKTTNDIKVIYIRCEVIYIRCTNNKRCEMIKQKYKKRKDMKK